MNFEVVQVSKCQVGLITLLFMYVVCLLFYAIGRFLYFLLITCLFVIVMTDHLQNINFYYIFVN